VEITTEDRIFVANQAIKALEKFERYSCNSIERVALDLMFERGQPPENAEAFANDYAQFWGKEADEAWQEFIQIEWAVGLTRMKYLRVELVARWADQDKSKTLLEVRQMFIDKWALEDSGQNQQVVAGKA
jgi:hypothetical protein